MGVQTKDSRLDDGVREQVQVGVTSELANMKFELASMKTELVGKKFEFAGLTSKFSGVKLDIVVMLGYLKQLVKVLVVQNLSLSHIFSCILMLNM